MDVEPFMFGVLMGIIIGAITALMGMHSVRQILEKCEKNSQLPVYDDLTKDFMDEKVNKEIDEIDQLREEISALETENADLKEEIKSYEQTRIEEMSKNIT